MIGICTMTSHEIANWEKKEETSLLEFFFGYVEPATELLALPQRGCKHHKFLHSCIAITEFVVTATDLYCLLNYVFVPYYCRNSM